MFSLDQGMNREPSDPEADDIPICHFASPKINRELLRRGAVRLLKIKLKQTWPWSEHDLILFL